MSNITQVIPTMQMVGNVPMMSTQEIAALTGKKLGHIHFDIRKIIDELKDDRLFDHQQYQEVKDGRGYTSEFFLNKELTTILVSGYSIKMRAKIVRRLEQLETQQQAPTTQSRIALNDEVASTFKTYALICESAGITGNAKTLAANNATLKRTGVNALEDMGMTDLLSEKKEQFYTANGIANRIGMRSGRDANRLLMQMGLQIWFKNQQGKPTWELTERGKKHGAYYDTGVKCGKNRTVMIKQIKWLENVIPAIKLYLDQKLELDGGDFV